MDGILLINKPTDFTSFDVVAKVRGILRERKIGHGGTLDPMATGILPLFIGKAAKAIDLAPITDKRYIAEFKLGITTDTLDITGTVTKKNSVKASAEDVVSAMNEFSGEISQLPPMYSAVRINGQRLYDIARNGVTIERKPRTVTIRELKLLDSDEKNNTYKIDVLCSKGTYIRTLCSDIGEKLGCGAVLTSLVRTEALGYSVNETIAISELQGIIDNGLQEQIPITPVCTIFESYPKLKLSTVQAKMFCNGVTLSTSRIRFGGNDSVVTVWSESKFLGLAEYCSEKDSLYLIKLFI